MAANKERIWLAEYLRCFNATEAARRAGYKWPNKVGPAKKQKFAAEIAAAIEERVMSAEEALAHLSDMARTDLSDYVSGDGIDLDRLVADGYGHLIKGVKRVVTKFDDRTEVEIYDKQAALRIVLDHHTRGPRGDANEPIVVRVVHDR